MPELAVADYSKQKIERLFLEENSDVLQQIFFPTKAVGSCPMMSVNLATGARQ